MRAKEIVQMVELLFCRYLAHLIYSSLLAIIIGCSGSTGSSLLKTILNRHSHIFAGPETCLFAYPSVYQNWQVERNKLLNHIVTDGWVIRRGVNLLQAEYGWQEAELQQLLQTTNSFQAFVTVFFKKSLQKNQKAIWIEKTPVNAYGFRAFLENYPTGKVIQIIRNPYDTIASLMARGMNAYYATGYYVYNTAVATSCYQSPRYYQLKYEDLVANPKTTIAQLCQFLQLPFEEEIIKAKHEQRSEPTTMKGWQHHETAKVVSSSIGRFQQLTETEKKLVHAAIASFSISPIFLKKHKIQFTNCRELCEKLDYPYATSSSYTHPYILRKYQWKNKLSRWRFGGRQTWQDYPGKLF